MLNNFNPGIFLEFLLIIGGAALLLYGLLTDKKDKGRLRIQRCSAKTDAHITGFDDRDKIIKVKKYKEYRSYNTFNSKKTEIFYAPYVKFQDEKGEIYEVKYPYPLERRLSNNQKISIKYNPNNPYDFYIVGDKKVQIFSTQAILLGAVLIISGILLLFNLFKLY